MTGVFLCRHAPTEWNRQGRFQGRADSPLVADADQRLMRLDEVLIEHTFDRVFCSPQKRARQSLAALQCSAGVPVEYPEALREIDFGDWTGITPGEIPASAQGERERNHWHYRWPGGESNADVFVRTKDLLPSIRSAEGNVLIMAHETVNRTLIAHLLGLAPEKAGNIKQPNQVIYRVREGQLSWFDCHPQWHQKTFIGRAHD